MRFIAYSIWFLTLNLVTGCASFYDISASSLQQYHKPVVVESNFDLSGRFFISTYSQHEYGNFSWVKTESGEDIYFNTPLGQTIAKIEIVNKSPNNNIASLYINNKIYTGSNLDLLMLDRLGFVLPISYLHYWMQGLPLPQVPITAQDTYGFSQLGWQIQYLEWYNNSHPKIIKLNNNDTTIKLLLQW